MVPAAPDHVETQVVDEETVAAIAKRMQAQKVPDKSLEPVKVPEQDEAHAVRFCSFLFTGKEHKTFDPWIKYI